MISAGALLLAVGLALSGSGGGPVLRLQDASLVESSGLAASARHQGILWTHNDGGERAEVAAIDADGRTVARVRLGDIDPYDPEALAPGVDESGQPALFLGDIGDNRLRRPDVSVFRFREPALLTDATVRADWYRFRYPDGPHDAEALLVDPRDGRLLIATKEVFGGGLYAAPRAPRPGATQRLRRIGDVPSFVTDGTFLPDGRFVLRSYSTAFLYDAPDRLLAKETLPVQRQGESVTVRDGGLLVGSEGVHSAVYAVPIPAQPVARDERGAATTPPSPVGDDLSLGVLAGVGVVALGGVIIVFVAATRRRRG